MIFFDHEKRIPGRGWWGVFFWWTFCSLVVWVYMTLCYRLKCRGRENLRFDGPALYVANHNSFLDPMALGLLVHHKPFIPMVRQTLFDTAFGGWFMRGMQAIPMDRSKGESAPFKEALAQLEAGRRIIIFPEGSRSSDGAMKEFKRGLVLIIKRAKVPVVPLAVEGTFDAWPTGRKYPKLTGRVRVCAAPAIDAAELLADGPDAAMERLKREIETMRLELRTEIRQETKGRLPAPGPGDVPYWKQEEE